MKVQRNKNGVKITLPKYKINVRKLSGSKPSYQYTCILPPVLCSYFGVDTTDTVDPENNIYNNLLMFYEVDDEKIIISGNDFYEAVISYPEHNTLEVMTKSYGSINPEIEKYCKEHPINFKLFDRIHYREQYNTTVYQLKGKNSYRVTLPKQLFKEHIDHTKNNYILFTIDTTKEDLLTNKGVVTYEIIN